MTQSKLMNWLLGAALLAMPALGQAQGNYPDKPVKVIVAIPAGGSVDMVARLVSQKLTDELGQPFVVDNRGGASGFIGTGMVVKAPPDGYTLTVAPASFLATNKSVFKNLPYDPEKDLAPISKLVNQSMVMVVRSNSSFRSTNDVVAAAKANPGKLTYASAGDGTPHHLAAVLFARRAEVRMTHVPYKGGALAMNDVLSGNVDIVFAGLPEALPHIKSGRIRALGLLSDKRSAVAPEIPTMKERGLGDLTLSAWMGLLAPAGTPAPVIDKLQRALVKVLAGDAKDRLAEVGLEAAPTTPAEFRKIIADEIGLHAELIKAAGITPQ